MAQFNVGFLLGKSKKTAEVVNQVPSQKVLFVCTGNIARSASAQYLAAQLSDPVSGWTFDSAGTGAVVGSGLAPHLDYELEKRGIDHSSHSAKQIDGKILADAALVLVMEEEHRNWILREWPQYRPKVHLLKHMARLRERAGRRSDPIAYMAQIDEASNISDGIDDPYRRGPVAAQQAVEEIEEALKVVIPWLGH